MAVISFLLTVLLGLYLIYRLIVKFYFKGKFFPESRTFVLLLGLYLVFLIGGLIEILVIHSVGK